MLQREAELWSSAGAPAAEVQPAFEALYAEDATLINPWTVELSRDSRWAGFQHFGAEYEDCEVVIHKVVLDHTKPGLFAVERTFACTNKETGVRGKDEDFAVGEIVPAPPGHAGYRIRYCRVYFDSAASCQEERKSTGTKYGWNLGHVVNI